MMRIALAACLLSTTLPASAGFMAQGAARGRGFLRAAPLAAARRAPVAQVRHANAARAAAPSSASDASGPAFYSGSGARGSGARAESGSYRSVSWSSFSHGRGLDHAAVLSRSRRAFALARRVDAEPPAQTETPAEPAMPIVEHQLIRSEGLGFKYEQPAEGQRFLAVDAGSRIEANGYAQALSNHPQLFVGKKDKLPPPNPGTTGASGANAITEHSED